MFFKYSKIIFILCYSYIAFAHNILRLPNYRSGKFQIRHENKVPAIAPFSEFNTTVVDVCFDQCVATPPCKSINYNSSLDTCQLVAYDINHGKDYIDKEGWVNYDTGRTQLTRILSSNPAGYCFVPRPSSTSGTPCDDSGATMLYGMFRATSHAHCQGIEAYFIFDLDAGVVVHYCSSLVMRPHPTSPDWLVFVQVKDYPYMPFTLSHITYRWRLDHREYKTKLSLPLNQEYYISL